MPELPEVETTLRAIEKFKNQRLYNIKVHNRNLRWKVDKDLEINSKNQIIKNLRRRAKYIIFDLDKCSIILHLGMSGSLRIANNDDNYFLKHDHVEFLFENEKIIYNDPRRFGSIHLTEDIDKHRLINHLGPEPLSKDFNSKYLLALCSRV
jgi:formamidopyrimidine-DNA glycosylase